MAKRQRRDVQEAAAAVALLSAQLTRLERLPTLNDLLHRQEVTTTDLERRAQFHQAATAAGFTVRPHNPKRYRIVRSPRAS